MKLTQLIANPAGIALDIKASGGKRRYGEMTTLEGLRDVASYADGISIIRDAIIPRRADGRLGVDGLTVDDPAVARRAVDGS